MTFPLPSGERKEPRSGEGEGESDSPSPSLAPLAFPSPRRGEDCALTLVVARAANGVIGREGELPWRIPADLKRFKKLTLGKPMIMGRKTFESLPGPLPGRRHIVLTRDRAWRAEGAEVAHDVETALALTGGPASVIGGADIYRLFLPLADRIELTDVHGDWQGDTMLEAFGDAWRETEREDQDGFSFVTLERAP